MISDRVKEKIAWIAMRIVRVESVHVLHVEDQIEDDVLGLIGRVKEGQDNIAIPHTEADAISFCLMKQSFEGTAAEQDLGFGSLVAL